MMVKKVKEELKQTPNMYRFGRTRRKKDEGRD